MGYEAYREGVFERQKQLGIIAATPSCRRSTPTPTTTSHDGKPWPQLDTVRPWDSLTDDEQRLFSRMAEVYAGFLSHADHELGRLLDHLEESRRARQHDHRARLRQRRVGRGRPERLGQREQVLQRPPRHDRGEPQAARRAGRPAHLQPLPDRLGLGVQHAVQAVEALRQLRGRHRRSADRLLAEGHRGQGRGAPAVRARRSTSCRRCSSASASRCRTTSTATRRSRSRASASPRRSRTPTRRRTKKTQFYSMLGTRAIWHKGWKAATAVPAAPESWGDFHQQRWELFDTDERPERVPRPGRAAARAGCRS